MPAKPSPPQAPVQGVFSTMETRKVGTGQTQRKATVKQYWLVRQVAANLAEVQPINEHLIPVGKKRTIALDTLLERFAPEPDFYIQHPDSAARQDMAERDAPPAPPAPLPGLRVEIEGFELSGSPENVETNARASFGLGLTYLRRGNQAKAVDIFTRLAEMDAPFVPEHKHMFNDFGVSLRKQSLFDLALKHYLRALALAGEDDHLLHNIARAYFEKQDLPNCIRYLEKSLELNPDLAPSRQFLKHVGKHGTARRSKAARPKAPLRFDF
ncbi:tetratricopeptide repeat protein [Desulfocurvus vexinensis]|uniref:tetratricopeptide repeat protein n=1 Tax=Desulfocurvus vexinensis TaxID=399548 RepID=UPI00048C01D2|nr:tetratricopeptide repeat protein [Desulfocurvus vexinensis]